MPIKLVFPDESISDNLEDGKILHLIKIFTNGQASPVVLYAKRYPLGRRGP